MTFFCVGLKTSSKFFDTIHCIYISVCLRSFFSTILFITMELTLTQDDAWRAPSLPRWGWLVFVRMAVTVAVWMWVAVCVTCVRGRGFARWRLLLLLLLLLRMKMRMRPVLGVPATGRSHLIEAQWFLHLRHRQCSTLLLRKQEAQMLAISGVVISHHLSLPHPIHPSDTNRPSY